MKYKIIMCLLVMIMVVGCTSKGGNQLPVDTPNTTEEDQSVDNKIDDNHKDNDNAIDNEDEENPVKDEEEKETSEAAIDNVSEPLKKFIGDWKIKAAFDEDFFITEELTCQENGIGIYPDHMIIYAYEVRDYILCNIEIVEVLDKSLTLIIKDRRNASGRSREDHTKLILTLDEDNNIIKGNFMNETENGTYTHTYIYEKDTRGFLKDYYTAIQDEKDKLNHAQLESMSKKMKGEWFRDYKAIKESEYLRFDEYNGIGSYVINEQSIWSNYYDLDGKLSYKSGEETYRIVKVIEDTAILDVEKEQGESDNILGLYYTIQLQEDKVYIRKFDYLSSNMYLFNEQKVVNKPLDFVITTANHMNNLFAFGDEQKNLFNKIMGHWGTLEDGEGIFIYNLNITPYYIDFYRYATGYIESLNFKILDINVKEKNVLLDINQYSWWDEVNGETTFLDNQILIRLNEDDTKLYFQIVHEQKENLFFEMSKDYINDVEFDKKQEE